MIDVDQLAAIAAELAIRVRDDTPADNGRWLSEQLPDPDDRWALCFVLAAAIPDDRPWAALTAWARIREHTETAQTDPGDQVDEGEVLRPPPSSRPRPPREVADLQPCGTPAAAARHRYHGEELCSPCRLHEQIRDRIRKAESRRADA
jgi:hypothetical protein